MFRSLLTVSLTLLGVAASAQQQQQQQPAAPASAPAAPPRFQFVMPVGYERVQGDGYTVVCLPRDAAWVRSAVGAVKPATRPTTMPADVLKRVTDNRAAVVKQMVADLALSDDKAANRFFDESLIPTLKKLDAARPSLFLLVATKPQMLELVASGWGEPRFRYNRVANDVSIDDRISLSIDRPVDDTVLPFFYNDREPTDATGKRLTAQIQKLQSDLQQTLANEAQPAVFNRLGQFLEEQVFAPLGLRKDQVWVAMGINGYLAGKYGSQMTGVPLETWIRMTTYEDRRYPVSARPIDLVHPADPATLKPGAEGLYVQAMRRKSVAAVNRLVAEKGVGALTKALVALREKKPVDGPAVVKLVQDATGVDLSKDVAPQ